MFRERSIQVRGYTNNAVHSTTSNALEWGEGGYEAVRLREERLYRSTLLPLEVEDLCDYMSEPHEEIDRNR